VGLGFSDAERTTEGYSFQRGAGSGTKSFAGDPREEAARLGAATAIAVCGLSGSAAPILAAPVYDFNVWSQAKKKEKLNYMHANPVKSGLVTDAKDWPWSSYSFRPGAKLDWLSIDPVD
jgi:hypothetical protein